MEINVTMEEPQNVQRGVCVEVLTKSRLAAKVEAAIAIWSLLEIVLSSDYSSVKTKVKTDPPTSACLHITER